ncbi:MAG: PD-(D/E)XK nuclease-like domain-containing protein [Chloroflexi bacterium]|nr:PD-(D/E)XK nuclease-like domain-containing protein [Chloroflexota bacterium]
MTPGIYNDITNDDYHAGPGLSSSALKAVLKSPLHYRHEYLLGNKGGSSAAMNLGSLVHTLILEPEKYSDEYLSVDVTTRNTKAYKEAVAANPEKTLILADELETATAIRDAIRANPTALTLIEGARREVSLYWHQDGRLCKCRPDAWRGDIRLCADLKTTADASPLEFQRSIVKYGYHISAAWYCRGIHAITGHYPAHWAWVAVETKPPYAVMVYAADETLLERGDTLCQEAIARLEACETTGRWPAYSDQIETITLPAWAA